MFATHTILWSMIILQVALLLPTGSATSGDSEGELMATSDVLELRILSVTSTSVTVQWNCTTVYNLSLTWKGIIKNAVEKWKREDTKVLDVCQNFSAIGQEVNMSIIDLEEGVEYHLSLTDGSVVLGLKHFSTLTSVPSGPPIYLRAHPVNPATMHISWTRPKLLDCNGDVLQYIIMVDSGSDEHSYTLNVTSQCVSRTCTKIRCLFHHFNIPKSELVPHENYAVKVAAVNANGRGPFSSAITVLSGDDKAGPPENLQVTHSGEAPDEFMLQWDMPRNPNGVILGYEVEYGVVNDTNTTTDYTDSTTYMLQLLSNETYTIAVYAENSVGIGSVAEIQWPLPDDSISSKKFKNHTGIIVGCCMGALGLILAACVVIVCIRRKYKKYSNKLSSKFYPAPMDDHVTSTVVVNPHYIFAEHGPPTNTLAYDYPFIDVNGAQAVALQPKGSTKSSNRNSTSTCGYIEMSVLMNQYSKPRSASFAAPNTLSNNTSKKPPTVSASLNSINRQLQRSGSATNCNGTATRGYIEISVPMDDNSKPSIVVPKGSSNLSEQPSTLQQSRKPTSRNSTSTCGNIEMPALINDNTRPHSASFSVPNSPSNVSKSGSLSGEYQNDIRALLSPPAVGARVNTKANMNIDNGYVTIRN